MLSPPDTRLAVLRLSGELSTKARSTRRRFLTQLVHNLEDALAAEGVAAEVERAHERVYVRPADAAVVELATRVFGVQSVSLAERVPCAGLDELVATAAERFRDAVRGRAFAVRARVVGGARPLRSAGGTSSAPSAPRSSRTPAAST